MRDALFPRSFHPGPHGDKQHSGRFSRRTVCLDCRVGNLLPSGVPPAGICPRPLCFFNCGDIQIPDIWDSRRRRPCHYFHCRGYVCASFLITLSGNFLHLHVRGLIIATKGIQQSPGVLSSFASEDYNCHMATGIDSHASQPSLQVFIVHDTGGGFVEPDNRSHWTAGNSWGRCSPTGNPNELDEISSAFSCDRIRRLYTQDEK